MEVIGSFVSVIFWLQTENQKQYFFAATVASNANIGGATLAAVLATSFDRTDLKLPGILVGSIGNVLGIYPGILVAEYLK